MNNKVEEKNQYNVIDKDICSQKEQTSENVASTNNSQILINEKMVESSNSNTVSVNNVENKLTPYQEFLQRYSAGYKKYKDGYFAFYDDVKDKTHRIYDW